MSELKVKSIFYYPVKSCAGTELQEAQIGLRGIINDRLFMITDESGSALTQREEPKLALIKPHFENNILYLNAPGFDKIKIDKPESGSQRLVTIWGDTCIALDQGEKRAEWLSNYLHRACRLVYMKPDFQRKLNPEYAISEKDNVGFADGYPFLLIAQESLDGLNTRLDTPVPMDRFRPNIVIEGCNSFEEDSWQRIKINSIQFEVVKPCIRCIIPTIDQKSLKKTKEPLATLTTFRHLSGKGILFGQNLIQHSIGQISVGDQLTVLERKKPFFSD